MKIIYPIIGLTLIAYNYAIKRNNKTISPSTQKLFSGRSSGPKYISSSGPRVASASVRNSSGITPVYEGEGIDNVDDSSNVFGGVDLSNPLGLPSPMSGPPGFLDTIAGLIGPRTQTITREIFGGAPSPNEDFFDALDTLEPADDPTSPENLEIAREINATWGGGGSEDNEDNTEHASAEDVEETGIEW